MGTAASLEKGRRRVPVSWHHVGPDLSEWMHQDLVIFVFKVFGA